MTKQLHVLQIISYYDIPLIFIAIDEIDTKFICLLVNEDSYISTEVSANRLSEFMNNNEDLRDIFTTPETHQIYSFNGISDTIEAILFESELTEEYLPEYGFKYEKPLDT